ncbi:5'/3'-nucleotidase SurE [Pluralibacter gergoviae]|uniref:5'/3'-nucleotidase SurE n=1 Tax=Pluralibacter gergoviae TaxID=61647 RepID=UPI0004F69D75|nr:5'/3'-nucleotidase SurE [Pluralibacter gergoviae]AIQ99129.1 5'/3'-nucleotidase SurE [Pluralibacter gergoviae]
MKTALATALLLSACALSASAAPNGLRILLVNDDGCRSTGTTSLQEKLAAKGYDVWLVAPATNQSGIGSAITFKPGKVFEVQKVAEKRYCFPGTPADALDFGLWGIMKDKQPDLVISGVNDGPNTGMAQVNSGTVGAAARAVRYGFPAIAASIGVIFNDEEMKNGWPSTQKYWPDSVDYVVSLVDKLSAGHKAGEPLLPKGSGLSINYPPLAKEKILGERYVDNENFPTAQIGYELLPDGKARQITHPDAMKPAQRDTDSGLLSQGYITWTPIDGSWNAPQYQPQYQAIFKQK